MYMDNIDDQETQILLDSLAAFNLTQHVRIPTQNKGHTLNIMITTTEDETFQSTNAVAGPYILYHILIILETSETKLETEIERQKIRKINTNTIHEFCESFNNDPTMQAITLEQVVNNMDEEMLRTLDLVVPTKEVKAKKRKPKPWHDEDAKTAKENTEEQGRQMVQIKGGYSLACI